MFDKFEIGSYDSEDFRTGNLPAEFLEDSNFSDCLFTGRKFENQLFYGYYCCDCDFRETTFLNCHITKINCQYNNYSNAYFENTRFLRAELFHAVFKGAYFKNVSFIVTVKPTTATPNTTPLPVCTDRGIYHFKSTFQGKTGLSDDSNLKK